MQIEHDDATGQPIQTGLANPLPVSTPPPVFSLVFTDATLIAAASSVVSGWFDLESAGARFLHMLRASTGGTYALEVDWSRDGAAVDVTEALTPANNASITKDAVTRYCRIRIRNTDGVAAFTAHRSTITAR